MKNTEVYWSKFAQIFEQKNNYVVGEKEIQLVLDKISELKNLRNTLELGCGNGTYSKVIAKNVSKLTATDLSEDMVNITRTRLKAHKHITVEIADCFNLHYPSESFNTLFMANLLHIIDSPQAVLLEVRNVLETNGRVVILDFGMEGMRFINKLKLVYRYRKAYGKPPKTRQKLTLKSIEKMLLDTNFKIENSSLIGNKMKCAFIIAQKR
jgi:ubiquinone/menaquinone biosynthesis C-methylase UbiE